MRRQNRQSRRVARWVQALIDERSPRRLRAGDEELDALRAAIELKSVSPAADAIDPDFAARLHDRLARETGTAPSRPPLVTRRTLLWSGGVAAAGVAAGVVADHVITSGTGESNTQTELVPEDGRWVAVAAVAELPPGRASRFTAGAIEGVVLNRGGTIEAISASCTHQGCLLSLNTAAGRLDCPCHRAAFALDGTLLFHSLPQAPSPLPRLQNRVRGGQIEVLSA